MDKILTHTSYHNSGNVNHYYSGRGDTSHEHPDKQRWKGNPDADGPLYKYSDDGWRDKNGNIFRGSNK